MLLVVSAKRVPRNDSKFGEKINILRFSGKIKQRNRINNRKYTFHRYERSLAPSTRNIGIAIIRLTIITQNIWEREKVGDKQGNCHRDPNLSNMLKGKENGTRKKN